MQRKLGYRVYLVGYGGGKEEEGRKERDRSCLSKKKKVDRERA